MLGGSGVEWYPLSGKNLLTSLLTASLNLKDIFLYLLWMNRVMNVSVPPQINSCTLSGDSSCTFLRLSRRSCRPSGFPSFSRGIGLKITLFGFFILLLFFCNSYSRSSGFSSFPRGIRLNVIKMIEILLFQY